MDVLRHLLRQTLDLRPNLLDRHRDRGEVGPGLGTLDAAGQRDDRLLEGTDVPARRELVDRLAQAHGFLLKLDQSFGRRDGLLDPGFQPAREVHAHAGDDAAVGCGGREARLGGLRQLALPLTDVLDGAADVGSGGAARRPGWRVAASCSPSCGHPALDVAEPLGHQWTGRCRLQRALDAGLDLREAPRLGFLGWPPLVGRASGRGRPCGHQRGNALAEPSARDPGDARRPS